MADYPLTLFLSSAASVLAVVAFVGATVWPTYFHTRRSEIFFGLTISAGVLVLLSYLALRLRFAEQGLNTAKTGLYTNYPRLCMFGWIVTASAYVFLYALTADNYNTISESMFRYVMVLFTWFPLSAMCWSLAVINNSVKDMAVQCVRLTALLSLGFILTAGQISSDFIWLQWIAVAFMLIQHVLVDAIAWVRMMEGKSFFGSIHAWAACLHLASAFAIYVYGIEKSNYSTTFYKFPVSLKDWDGFDPYVWEYTCKNRADVFCRDDDKNFVIRDRYNADNYVHLLALTSGFALWSSLGHVVAAGTTSQKIMHWTKWFDYAGSAPMMLIVVSLQYGHYQLPGIVLAPTLLGILILIAGYVRENEEKLSYAPGVFVVSVLLYALTWFPSGYTFDRAFNRDYAPSIQNDVVSPGVGEPPKFVWGFYAFTVAVFSSFPVIYGLQIIGKLNNRQLEEKAYIALSLIAKLTLHLYVGLITIGSAATLDESHLNEMESLSIGIPVTIAIIILVIILVKFVGIKDEDIAHSYVVVYNPAYNIYEGYLKPLF